MERSLGKILLALLLTLLTTLVVVPSGGGSILASPNLDGLGEVLEAKHGGHSKILFITALPLLLLIWSKAHGHRRQAPCVVLSRPGQVPLYLLLLALLL